MTRTLPILPLALALKAALKYAHRPAWYGCTTDQELFLTLLAEYETGLGQYDRWVDATAAPTAAEINAWLAERGFDITLDDWTEEDSFGVAASSDVRVNWVEAGERSLVFTDNNSYPAFELDVKDGVAAVYVSADGQPVIEFQTKEGMIARIQMRDDPGSANALAAAGLKQHLAELGEAWLKRGAAYDQVRVPMVLLSEKPDLGWLIGAFMPKPGAPNAKIAQAVGQVKFAMNELGARSKETVAIQVVYESALMTTVFEVSKAFLLTIGFEGVPPVVVAHITEENWVDPGNLDDL